MSNLIGHSDLEKFINSNPNSSKGCFVDTNLLFAADYDLDKFNEEAVEICEALVSARIPIFSTSTIRSELLELKRRVLVTESLIDFYHHGGSRIPKPLFSKLKSLRDRATSRWNGGDAFFLGDRLIKEMRFLFIENLGENTWIAFCKTYLGNKLEEEWNNQVASRGVGYLDQEHPELVIRRPEWNEMVQLIQTYGIGASDAMIINFFLCTTLQFIVTSDKDVAFCISKMGVGRTCVIPANLKM